MLVIFLAGYLAENRVVLAGASLRIGPLKLPPLPYLAPMLVVFAAVMLVVVVSRDLGTALLFFGVFLTMLFVSTGRRSLRAVRARSCSWPAPPSRTCSSATSPSGSTPGSTRGPIPNGAGYQTVQAIYAFARGGLLGEGLGQGLPMVDGNLPIPAVQTDMIYRRHWRGAGHARRGRRTGPGGGGHDPGLSDRRPGTPMTSAPCWPPGCVAGLVLQSLIIIGGNLKVVPLTGITLPFISYGGSSLLASFVVVGLLLSISHRSVPAEVTDDAEADR